jgi:hypothetical protein
MVYTETYDIQDIPDLTATDLEQLLAFQELDLSPER